MASPWERRRKLTWKSTGNVSDWLVDQVDPKPGQTCLSSRPASARPAFRREPLGKKGPLISSDFSPQMVHTVEHVAKELGISDAEFRMLDAERIELDDAGVDALLCRYSYMLFSEPLLLRRYWRRPVEDPNGGDEWAPVTDGCESAVRRPERTMRRSGTRPSGRSA